MGRRTVSLTEGPILSGLFQLFWPIMLGALLQQCYNTIDVAIVGNCLGKEALAAVGGTSSTMTNLMMEFLVGISSGAAVVIAQYFGADRRRELSESVRTAMGIGAVLGLVLGIAGIVMAPSVLGWLHAPAEIAGMAKTYLQTYFCGLVPMALYNTGAAILRAVGDTKRPLYFLVLCCILNLLLDLLFVAGLGWGILGAALATVVSQTLSAVLVLWALFRSRECFRLSLQGSRDWGRNLKQMLAIGLPSGLQAVMYSISNMVVQSQVNTFSTDVIAASSVFDRLEGFFWMMFNAYGVAVLTFMGQNYGAGEGKRMRRGIRIALAAGVALALLLSGLAMAGGRWFFRMFTNDTAVQEMGLSILYFMMPWYFIYVFIEVFSGAIRSTGEAVKPMLICSFGICAVRMAWGLWVAPAFHEIRVLLLGYPISWTVTAGMFLVYYRFGGPRERITKIGPGEGLLGNCRKEEQGHRAQAAQK